VTRNWIPGKAIKKGAGIHYENEGNKKAYIYANVEKYDSEVTHIFGQVSAHTTISPGIWVHTKLPFCYTKVVYVRAHPKHPCNNIYIHIYICIYIYIYI
jgi:hypothetical protein